MDFYKDAKEVFEKNKYVFDATELAKHDKQIRADAIDDFMKALCSSCKKQPCYEDECYQKKLAEQLKEKKDE